LSATSLRPFGASAANSPVYFSAEECVQRSVKLESKLSVNEAAFALDTNAMAASAQASTTACRRAMVTASCH